MPAMARPSLSARIRPVNATTAPTSVRPPVRPAISAPTSKSAVSMRPLRSASRPRRKQGDFSGPSNAGTGLHLGLIDGGPDPLVAVEGIGGWRALLLQPVDERGHEGNAGGQHELFLGPADLLAHPGEVHELYPHRRCQAHLVLDRRAHGRLEIIKTGPQGQQR